MLFSFLLKSSINKSDKGMMKFDENGMLASVEFKLLNLNEKHEWKKVYFNLKKREF
jgi:hypothetical protein